MVQAILVIHLLTALVIIGLIMMQQGKGAEAGASFGAGASQTIFGSAGSWNFFSRMTAIFATIFFITSIALAVIAKNSAVVEDPYLPEAEQVEIPAAANDQEIPAADTAAEIPTVQEAVTEAATEAAVPEQPDAAVEQPTENVEAVVDDAAANTESEPATDAEVGSSVQDKVEVPADVPADVESAPETTGEQQ